MTREDIHILIADRNSKVSGFLRRELAALGFYASVARDAEALWEILAGPEPTELLILDPELFSSQRGEPLLSRLSKRKPGLPVLVYAFDTESLDPRDRDLAVEVVEKEHDIEHLKEVVERISRRLFPERLI